MNYDLYRLLAIGTALKVSCGLCASVVPPLSKNTLTSLVRRGGASMKKQAMHIHASRASHLALATHFSIHFIVGAWNTSFLLFVG